jgi:hypothetical protein
MLKKKKSKKQEERIAKQIGGKTVIASGALYEFEVNGHTVQIDAEDWDRIKGYHFRINSHSYAILRTIQKGNDKRREIPLHRFILGVQDNPEVMVDHIDRNPLNNRKNNLRICTASQNQMNRSRSQKCKKTSKYRGVSYDAPTKKWKVTIKLNRKSIHGGYFDNEEEAGMKYNELAIKYHGEFAVLNKIGDEADAQI